MVTAKKVAAKSTTKTTNDKRWAQVQVPEGYEAVTSDAYGEPWEYEDEPLLVGATVGGVRIVTTGSGKNARESRVTSIRKDDGTIIDVWESAALVGLFDKIEDAAGEDRTLEVAIAFKGYRDTGKGNPLKVFTAAVKPDEESKVTRRARK